jgi:hypothetical protein
VHWPVIYWVFPYFLSSCLLVLGDQSLTPIFGSLSRLYRCQWKSWKTNIDIIFLQIMFHMFNIID